MRTVFELDLPNDEGSVAIAQAACLAAADRHGLAADKRMRLELAVEEVVVNAVHHAYPAGAPGRIRVSALAEGSLFSVRVQDWGLPYDPSEMAEFSPDDPHLRGLGLHLAWRSCDEAVFQNLGRDGKRFDLRFRLPPSSAPVSGLIAAAEPPSGKAASPAVEIRPFEPADAPGVSRCAWLAYGYTKPDDHLYDPAELVRLNRQGAMVGMVAAGADGTIHGHACLDLGHNPRVPEFTDLVVAPAARGNPLLVGRLLQLGFDTAKERGCLGVLANAVTAHTVSQRGALRFGGVPMHVHLASVSTDWDLTPGTEKGSARQSEIALYVPIHAGPARELHCPPRHRGMVEGICTAIGEPVAFADPLPKDRLPAPAPSTELVIESGLLAWGHVVIGVRSYGRDAVAVVAGFLRRFCQDAVATVLLELPLADPATAVLADRFERLGFSVAGVFPNAARKDAAGEGGPGCGDVLLYQYLNNVVPDLSGERVAAACRPLYEYVMVERRRVDLEVYGATQPAG